MQIAFFEWEISISNTLRGKPRRVEPYNLFEEPPMHVIRTIQYAILAFAFVVTVCWFATSGSAYLVFNKFLGFNRTANLGDQIATDPVYPTIFAIAGCLFFALEFFRRRWTRRKMDAG